MPKKGDIVMTARGTIGVGYIVKENDKFYYKDGNLILLRAIKISSPHFLLYAFKTRAILDQLIELVGTTVSHLPLEKAKKLRIRIPSIETQNKTVEHLEKMEAAMRDLIHVYQRKIAALDELKKSMLHRAFNGDL
jgi:type I restriction enzyme S subunit